MEKIEEMDREMFILSFLDYSRALAARRSYLSDPEDIAQECMLAVIEMCDSAMELEHPHSYVNKALVRIANEAAYGDGIIHRTRDVVRGKREEEYTICTITPEMVEGIPERMKERDSDWEWLYNCVERLPPRQREAIGLNFGLADYGYHSQTEIGKLRGTNKHAIQSNKRLGLKKLREMLT